MGNRPPCGSVLWLENMNADEKAPPSVVDSTIGSRFPWPHLRRRTLWALAVVAVVFAGGGTAAGFAVAGGADRAGTWFHPGSTKLEVNVAKGCPSSLTSFQDVVNTFPGPPLVPAEPRTGLICRYGPVYGLGPTPASQRLLATSKRLNEAQAQELATVIRSLTLTVSVGAFSCPADFGDVAVLGFAYHGKADVGLWYRTTGCQTVDNGRIGAFEGGNPSLYNGFVNLVERLSPPVALQSP
jgi:hypothetical protein